VLALGGDPGPLRTGTPAQRTRSYICGIYNSSVASCAVATPPARVTLGCPKCGKAVLSFERCTQSTTKPTGPWPNRWEFRLAGGNATPAGRDVHVIWPDRQVVKPGIERYLVRCECHWTRTYRTDKLVETVNDSALRGRRYRKLPG